MSDGDRLAGDDQAGLRRVWRGAVAAGPVSPGIDGIAHRLRSGRGEDGGPRGQQDVAKPRVGAAHAKLQLAGPPEGGAVPAALQDQLGHPDGQQRSKRNACGRAQGCTHPDRQQADEKAGTAERDPHRRRYPGRGGQIERRHFDVPDEPGLVRDQRGRDQRCAGRQQHDPAQGALHGLQVWACPAGVSRLKPCSRTAVPLIQPAAARVAIFPRRASRQSPRNSAFLTTSSSFWRSTV